MFRLICIQGDIAPPPPKQIVPTASNGIKNIYRLKKKFRRRKVNHSLANVLKLSLYWREFMDYLIQKHLPFDL
jgi:hypothetical protein